MPVQINISGADAAETVKELNALASHLLPGPTTNTPAYGIQAAPAQPTASETYTPPATPAPTAVPTTPFNLPTSAVPTAAPVTPPVAPQQPAQGAVPTAPPSTYTIDQLAVAATQLMDAGKQPELVNLLAQFGVQALTALPKEQFGNFATALRGLGARI